MTAYAPVSLTCPHCRGHFLENAKLVRPGGNAWCPDCETLFCLDGTDEATRRTLTEAKLARRRRKERLAEFKARWSDTPQSAPQPPMLMSDVLQALDELLVRLDGLHRRNQ